MTPLYAYSLLPVLSVSLLLFTSTLLYGRELRGLVAYFCSVAVWAASLLMFAFPQTSGVARHLAQVGAFVSASFIHVAYEFTAQKNLTMVWLAYGAAALITAAGVLWPGLLYDPGSLRVGPAFWPSMILAISAAVFPLWRIVKAYRNADRKKRRPLRILGISGFVGFTGAFANAATLGHGIVVPYPMLMVLASLLILAGLLETLERASGRRLFQRSLLYAAMTALLFAGFLFGVISLMNQAAEPLLREYKLGALFLLFLAALAFDPIRRHIQQVVGRIFFKKHAQPEDLAHALWVQETKANQAERLAELGQFASAVAHEVRNPLGVIMGYVRVLEHTGGDEEITQGVRMQVERASQFVDDLLRYGRPRPLELRMFDLGETISLAKSTALGARGHAEPEVCWVGLDTLPEHVIEGDQTQLGQVMLVIFENALHALAKTEEPTIQVRMQPSKENVVVHIEDSGPGIDPELKSRIFEPFVTGRKREGTQTGTGLGLAIAKNIVDRHHGELLVKPSELGGAGFVVCLPRYQKVLLSEGPPP